MTRPEHVAQGGDAWAVVTALLTDERGKTRLNATVLYPPMEVRDGVLQSGMSTGAGISDERLEGPAEAGHYVRTIRTSRTIRTIRTVKVAAITR